MQKVSIRLAWGGTLLLVTIGVLAAFLRYLLPHQWHLDAIRPFYGTDYVATAIPALAAIPWQEALHRLGGGLYMILGLFQFMPRFRARYPKRHRLMGKAFLLLSAALALGGIVLSIRTPAFGGWQGAIPTVFAGGLSLYFAAQAYRTARQRQFAQHREWVIRTFAIGTGVATIRIYFLVMSLTTTWPAQDMLPAAFWLGWMTNLVLAEWWINYTRPQRKPKTRRVAVAAKA